MVLTPRGRFGSRLKVGLRVAASVSMSVATLALARAASAAPMDPAPERLVLQPSFPSLSQFDKASCQSIAAAPETGFSPPSAGFPLGTKPANFSCRADNLAYRNMMAELGFALAPSAFHPARTTGLGGFALTFETSFTKINAGGTTPDGRQYWHDGTQGPVDPNNKQFSIVNKNPDGILQVYSLKARKGLGLGFELAGTLGYVANTSLWVTGADIRWSILEGFRTGALGYLPDVSVGGGVRTVAGSSKFFLTTVGIDVTLSKPIALADSAVLTPYIGYQRVLIFADSTVVDTTPNVDPLAQCGYTGPNEKTGAPNCTKKLSDGTDNSGDFNNNITFEKVRVHRHRGIAGLNYRYEVLYLAGQLATDITAPGEENPGLTGARQWTMSFEAGVFF